MERKMKLTRRQFSGLGLSAMAAVALTSCGKDDKGTDAGSGKDTAQNGDAVPITFSYLWAGAEAEAIEKIIADYNGSQDKVVVKGVSSPDMQKQLASMSSKAGAFDISDHFGNGVGAFAATGAIQPLDDLLSPELMGDLDDFVPAALQQMRYDGKLYSMPIAVHTFQLLYNTRLLKEAGVEPPTTFAELEVAIEALTKVDDNGEILQLGLGYPSLANNLTTLAYANGGTFDGSDPDKPEPTPEDPGVMQALDMWKTAVVDKFGADKLTKFKAGWGEYMTAIDPFYSEKVAMIIDGAWHTSMIPEVVPELEYGVGPVPHGPNGEPGSTQLTASTLFIPSNAKNPQEAADFMGYLCSSEGALAFAKALANLPSRISLADDPSMREDEKFAVFLDSLKEGDKISAFASAPYANQYSVDLNAAFDNINSDIATPEEAMSDLTSKAESYDR